MISKDEIDNPKWNDKRREILRRDGFRCACCDSKSYKTLNAHHLKYLKDVEYWNHPNELLITLCSDCHKKIHGKKDGKLNKSIEELFSIAMKRSHEKKECMDLTIEIKEDKKYPMFYFNGKKSLVYSFAYHNKKRHHIYGVAVRCRNEEYKSIGISKKKFDEEIQWLISLDLVCDFRYMMFIFKDVAK